MTIERVLECEVMQDREAAGDYEAMDHSEVNRAFVEDLMALAPWGNDVVDLGTGTARIPIALCRSCPACRVMAVDLSISMLELARLNIEIASMIHRVQLAHADMKQLPYPDAYFDVVMSNGTLHHLPDPVTALREAVRIARPGALLMLRDLSRPEDQETVEQLVHTYAAEASDRQQAQFAASLHAALRIDEMRAIVSQLGYAPDTVAATSDRHWTWVARKPSS